MAAMEWSQIMTVYACVQYEEFKCKQTMLTMFNNYSPKSRLISSLSLFGRIFLVYLPHLNTNDTNEFGEFETAMQTPDVGKGLHDFRESPGPPPSPPPPFKCLDETR